MSLTDWGWTKNEDEDEDEYDQLSFKEVLEKLQADGHRPRRGTIIFIDENENQIAVNFGEASYMELSWMMDLYKKSLQEDD